jgi:hypothetical protein
LFHDKGGNQTGGMGYGFFLSHRGSNQWSKLDKHGLLQCKRELVGSCRKEDMEGKIFQHDVKERHC